MHDSVVNMAGWQRVCECSAVLGSVYFFDTNNNNKTSQPGACMGSPLAAE